MSKKTIKDLTEKDAKKIVKKANLLAETDMTEKHLKILKRKNLFDLITKTEFDKKIVGEIETRQAIFLCACGMFVKNNQLSSYNLMVNSKSGAGKDWVTSKTLEIFPKENIVSRTRITENVFTYWHNPKFEPKWTWNGKTFYNEDISTNILNSDVFKVMSSSGSKATVLIHQKPTDIEIKGKPVIIITTANPFPSQENLRRFTLIDLDETVDQTKAIMKRQAELAKKGIPIRYNEKIREALFFLKRIKVKIPFADKILRWFPKEHTFMRTHFERFLDYIKASTALHQYQRQKDKNGFYFAKSQDYDIARIALLKTTSNPTMIPITKNQQRILDVFRKLEQQKLFQSNYYSVSELEPHITFISEMQLRRELDKLTENGFLKKSKEERA